MTLFHKVNRSGKAKVLSSEERALIKKELPEKYSLISEILYWSAGRISEVLSIPRSEPGPQHGDGHP